LPYEVRLGLGLPLLAAWWPVRRATARTVRAAMHDHGVRVAAPALPWRLPGVALNLAWRYAFRQRGRWLMTTALLAGAGAMAITCLNLRAAWQDTVARSALDRHYQVEWFLQAPAPQAALLAAARALPGVVQAEAWGAARGALEPAQGLLVQRSYPDGAHGGFAMRAAPPDTRLIAHTMAEGRWLQAGDVQGLVVNTLARNGAFRGVALGQWVQLRVGHRSLRLQLQGVVRELLTPGAAYVLPRTLAQAVEAGEGSNALRVALADAAQAEVVAQAGVLALQRQGWATRLVITEQRLAAAQGGHVFILVGALGFIAVLMAVVGLLGLASALGTAVVERSRELAVMRALGARGATLMQSLLIEGVLTGGISWLLALALAWPLSASVGQVLAAISAQPLVLRLSPGGAALWLACVLLGAALVSWWPATQAARLTVRQALSIT
jgi:putative ABC transport system permease protein